MTTVGLISLGLLEAAFMRRRAFLNQYLKPEHTYYRLLRGGLLLLIWQMLKALSLSLWLLLALLLLEWQAILLLGVDTLLLALGYQWYQIHFQTFIHGPYILMISRQYLVRLNTVLLTTGLLLLEFFMPHPNYQALAWNEAIQYEVGQIQTQCHFLGLLVRLMVALNVLGWWLAQTWLPQLDYPLLALGGWGLFLFSSLAFVWAYSRLLLSVLITPGSLFHR